MGKQAHDQGRRKRQYAKQPASTPDGQMLARELVERGLASKNILDSWRPKPHHNTTPTTNR